MEKKHTSTLTAISKNRLEFLFDGIFAIAMTILVLELKVPELIDRQSINELSVALMQKAPTFASYLLSFVMLGILWYRHNQHYHHFIMITKAMFTLHLIQLAAAAFFPFCAALIGQYPGNVISFFFYIGCILVYTWASLLNWVVAKRFGAITNEISETGYKDIRTRLLRACLIISILFALATVRLFNTKI